MPADDTQENSSAEKPASVPPIRLILFAVWTRSVALQNTHSCAWTFQYLSFPREKGLIPQSFPRAQAAEWGQGSTDYPDPKCAPKTRVWDVSRTSPLFSPGNLAQTHYPAVLQALEENIDLDRLYGSHKNASEFVFLSLFILSPSSVLYQHINIFFIYNICSFCLGYSCEELELLMGNSSCLWGLELGDL